jgi:hypothetical protein
MDNRIVELERAIHDAKCYIESKAFFGDWPTVAKESERLRRLEVELMTLNKTTVPKGSSD